MNVSRRMPPSGKPTQANLGELVELFNSGRHAELERRARTLLELHPDSAFCWKALGLALQMQGKDALPALRKAAELSPDDAEAHANLGNAFKDIGQFESAADSYRRALQLNSRSAMAHNNLGAALQSLGQINAAVASYRRALELSPDFAEAYNNLGNALQALGQHAAAAEICRRALQIQPDFAEAHNNLGNALKDIGDLNGALECYRRALELSPGSAEVFSNLGAVLQDIGQLDEAVTCFRQALELSPNYANAHNNLGNALQDLGQLDDAAASYRRALELKPDYADAHNNLGTVLQALGQFDAAVGCYRRVLELDPADAEAHSNLAYALLALGDLEQGWREYAWRSARAIVERRVHASFPDANALSPFTGSGKRILLCHEQGIGDELFFLRFAPRLRAQAQWLGYWASDKTCSLVERSGCVHQVLSRVDEGPQPDLLLPVGDLPLLLGCVSIKDIPQSLRLVPLEKPVTDVRRRLGESGLTGRRLLGITWRAGLPPVPGQRRSLFKQIGLEVLAGAIRDWDGAVLVLQRNPERAEIEALRAAVPCPVYDLSDCNDDLEAMLAVLDALDEYVGVSNTNMHLMAGLGKTARVLVPAPAEWRWMASGDKSPWFPAFKLYRELPGSGWVGALDSLAQDIARADR
jgi:tetratricopeptide (TPR) repeat protein